MTRLDPPADRPGHGFFGHLLQLRLGRLDLSGGQGEDRVPVPHCMRGSGGPFEPVVRRDRQQVSSLPGELRVRDHHAQRGVRPGERKPRLLLLAGQSARDDVPLVVRYLPEGVHRGQGQNRDAGVLDGRGADAAGDRRSGPYSFATVAPVPAPMHLPLSRPLRPRMRRSRPPHPGVRSGRRRRGRTARPPGRWGRGRCRCRTPLPSPRASGPLRWRPPGRTRCRRRGGPRAPPRRACPAAAGPSRASPARLLEPRPTDGAGRGENHGATGFSLVVRPVPDTEAVYGRIHFLMPAVRSPLSSGAFRPRASAQGRRTGPR